MTDHIEDHSAGTDEIEVTEGMMDAGYWTLDHSCRDTGEVSAWTLRKVYIAMEEQRLREKTQS